MGRGIEDKGQKGSDRGSGAHTHDQRREAWKTAESCGVTESSNISTYRLTFTVRVFGLLLGKAHSFVMERPSGRLYKHVFCNVKG